MASLPAPGAIARTSAPAATAAEGNRAAKALLVVGPFLALGLLVLAAAAVSPRRVPWPGIAEPLYAHRSHLAAIGLELVGLPILALIIIVVL